MFNAIVSHWGGESVGGVSTTEDWANSQDGKADILIGQLWSDSKWNYLAKSLDLLLGITLVAIGILAVKYPSSMNIFGLSAAAQWACVGGGIGYTAAWVLPGISFRIKQQRDEIKMFGFGKYIGLPF